METRFDHFGVRAIAQTISLPDLVAIALELIGTDTRSELVVGVRPGWDRDIVIKMPLHAVLSRLSLLLSDEVVGTHVPTSPSKRSSTLEEGIYGEGLLLECHKSHRWIR